MIPTVVTTETRAQAKQNHLTTPSLTPRMPRPLRKRLGVGVETVSGEIGRLAMILEAYFPSGRLYKLMSLAPGAVWENNVPVFSN